MPMTGRPSKASSGKPWFFIQLRWMKPSLSAGPNQAAERNFSLSDLDISLILLLAWPML
jgi:hypothetical protein